MALVTYYLIIAFQKDWTGLHSYHSHVCTHTTHFFSQQTHKEDATINLRFTHEKLKATEVK